MKIEPDRVSIVGAIRGPAPAAGACSELDSNSLRVSSPLAVPSAKRRLPTRFPGWVGPSPRRRLSLTLGLGRAGLLPGGAAFTRKVNSSENLLRRPAWQHATEDDANLLEGIWIIGVDRHANSMRVEHGKIRAEDNAKISGA